MTLQLGVLASGRGTNLQSILEAIKSRELEAEVRVVISDRREAKALERAREAGAPAIFLDPAAYNGKEAYAQGLAGCLEEHGVEWVALAGFMRLLGKRFLERFPGRVVNIHPALLPAFPGLDAQQQAFAYGVKYSGCTVHFVDEGVDTGPIIGQAVVNVFPFDTAESLAERILEQEHRLYPRALQWLAEGRVRLEGRRTVLLDSPVNILLPMEDGFDD